MRGGERAREVKVVFVIRAAPRNTNIFFHFDATPDMRAGTRF